MQSTLRRYALEIVLMLGFMVIALGVHTVINYAFRINLWATFFIFGMLYQDARRYIKLC